MTILFLQRLIELLTDYLATQDGSNASKLYIAGVCSLGSDASPNDVAPDEFGCAESVSDVHYKAFQRYIGNQLILSTAVMYATLKARPEWVEVQAPNKGDIVISPTGYGNGHLANGHVGIVSKDGHIMSSNSATGHFEENYTLDTWRARYVNIGGFPMKFYRRI